MILIFFSVVFFENSLQTIFETFMSKSSNFIGLDYEKYSQRLGLQPRGRVPAWHV